MLPPVSQPRPESAATQPATSLTVAGDQSHDTGLERPVPPTPETIRRELAAEERGWGLSQEAHDPVFGWPILAEELVFVLAFDKTLAELHSFRTRDDPLEDYYQRWIKGYELRFAEITGEGAKGAGEPLSEQDMQSCRNLRAER